MFINAELILRNLGLKRYFHFFGVKIDYGHFQISHSAFNWHPLCFEVLGDQKLDFSHKIKYGGEKCSENYSGYRYNGRIERRI